MEKYDFLIMGTKECFIQENLLLQLNQHALNGFLFLKKMQEE
jgi:hypothetical protein